MDEDFNQLKALTEVVKDAISHKESGSSKKLLYFIKRSLGQVGLSHEWEESDILIQAYLRVRDKILSGERISNHSAYLTRVAYFIILEESKRRSRRGQLNQKLSYVESSAEVTREKSYAEGVSDELMSSLWASFESLSARDRRLLILRIVKGLSWREISARLVSSGQDRTHFHLADEAAKVQEYIPDIFSQQVLKPLVAARQHRITPSISYPYCSIPRVEMAFDSSHIDRFNLEKAFFSQDAIICPSCGESNFRRNNRGSFQCPLCGGRIPLGSFLKEESVSILTFLCLLLFLLVIFF